MARSALPVASWTETRPHTLAAGRASERPASRTSAPIAARATANALGEKLAGLLGGQKVSKGQAEIRRFCLHLPNQIMNFLLDGSDLVDIRGGLNPQ